MKKFEGKWLSSSEEYKNACIDISNNLNNFKRHSIYARFIGNDSRNEETAIAFYNHIKNNYSFLLETNILNKLLINDNIGDPMIYNIEGIKISPGTLRFMKVLGDILSIDKNIKNVIEIGSGYGGQCLIIKLYSNDINYCLVDIPESLSVSKSYLNKNNCEAKFIDTNNIIIDNKYDLVISDYCLSELDYVGIEFYVKNIINRCKYGYFTINSKDELFKILITQLNTVFNDVQVNKEIPKTTYHDNHIITCRNNKLLI